ncbi:MAG: NAD(P)/FAD-dependent oxidoreductase, partial [Eggerthella lenta]
MTTDQTIDVAIIGGGPAGYAAAIYAARANLTTTVLEQGMSGGQIATSNEIENYPGIPLLSGAELGAEFSAACRGPGSQGLHGSGLRVIDYDADAALFTVHHDLGDTSASSVIACMGATPRSAGFVGEDAYRGRGVSYCATCDGMFFRGKQVFVIGGGNAACEEALFLSEIASSVTIVLRRDQFRAPDGVVQKVLAKDYI